MALAAKSDVLAAAVASNAICCDVAVVSRNTAAGASVAPIVSDATAEAERGTGVPLLIDTDCGIDDAQAILLAAAHPEKVNIVALTTVDGEAAEKRQKNQH